MGKRQFAQMKYKFYVYIYIFTGETKSCSLNVKLLTIQSADSVSKQVGLAGASGANLQQVKLKSTAVFQA